MPVAVAGLVGQQGRHAGVGLGGRQVAVDCLAPQGHEFRHVVRLRTQPQHVHPQGLQGGELLHQIADAGRLGLDAVEGEKGLALAGLQQQAVGVLDAAESAVVLGQVVVPCSEAARREGQRHAAEREHLGLQAGGALPQQGLQLGAGHFEGRHPAYGTQVGHPLQRGRVVEVEMRPGHERALPERGRPHGAHVVGLHQELVPFGDAVHGGCIAAGLDQHLGGEHHLLAGFAQLRGHFEPVSEAQLVAARAHGFAQVDDVHRCVGHAPVERDHGLARPVVEQGAQRQLHAAGLAHVLRGGDGVCRHGGHFQGRW